VLSLAAFSTALMGSTEMEFLRPVLAGDRVTVVFKLSRLLERQGSMGPMAFMTIDSDYTNQRQEPVARCRQMIIGY